jgi:membrane protein YdbS with pleckstrin-like domain
MLCPKCAAEVSEQSVYCHKCGERIDLGGQQYSPDDQAGAGPSSEDVSSGEVPDRPAAPPPPTPAEKFQETAALRQGRDEEPEEELWEGRYSSRAMINAWALSGLITIALVVLAFWIWKSWFTWSVIVVVALLWIYQLCVMKYRQWIVRYQLTNQRFIHQSGILRRVTDRIEVIDMDDITFEQGLLERFVGVGTICVTSSDRTHPELLLRGIQNVQEVAGKIDDTRRSERRRRGLHIESI